MMRLSGLKNSNDILRALKEFKRENKEMCKVHAILGELDINATEFTEFATQSSFRCLTCCNIVLYRMAQKVLNLKNSAATPILNLMQDIPSQQDFGIRNLDNYSNLARHLSPLALKSIYEAKNTIRLLGPENVYISFNGGKDSTVAMQLYLCAYYEYFSERGQDEFPNPKMIFFNESDGFQELNDFVDKIAKCYCFDLKTVNCCWKEGIKAEFNTRNNIAFIMGSRKTDPGKCGLECLQYSDLEESSFLLVNILREWSYGAIWCFILHFKIPYCSLYDQGYTSIGGKNSTLPNEELKDGPNYKPAYYLVNWDSERAGRGRAIAKDEQIVQNVVNSPLNSTNN